VIYITVSRAQEQALRDQTDRNEREVLGRLPWDAPTQHFVKYETAPTG
jgi:hypothetical protein